ncbi:uncharacterized protein ACBT44_022397 [Syngnathus typhle]
MPGGVTGRAWRDTSANPDPSTVWKGLQSITGFKKRTLSCGEPKACKPEAAPALQICEEEVRQMFRRQKIRKAPGPDGMSLSCLKVCAEQLAPTFARIFNHSLELCEVPSCFKSSTIVPVAKTPAITGDSPVKLLKYADDTTLIGLIQDGDETAYRQEVERQNHLELNPLKLTDVFTDIFNTSLQQAIVPSCFKAATIVPVPKKPAPSCFNDYRPVAVTPIIMKCFERLVMEHIRSVLPPTIDPFQFANEPNGPLRMPSALPSTRPSPTWREGTRM